MFYLGWTCFMLPGGLIDTRYRATRAENIVEVNDEA